MPSIGKLLSLNGGLPERVSSTDNATLTGDISGLGAVNLSSVTASGAVSSASLAVSGEADISGGLDVSGNFAVTGTSAHTGGATFASTVDISGALDLSGALTSSSSASFAGAMDAASLALSGNLDVSGSFDLSGAAVMSDTLNVAGAVTMTSSLNVNGDSQFAADVMVSGDLSVNGKIISRLQTDVVIKDTYLDLAFGNSTSGTSSVASQAGGFTVGQARNTNFTAGAVSAFPSTSTFTYADTGSSTLLAPGDVVAISGLPQEFAENEGYFIVASVSGASFPQTVTIETSLQQSLAWAQTSFTAGTPQSAGEAFKPNLSILAVADGTMAYKSGAGAAWPVGTLVLASYIGGGANGATKTLFQANGAYVAVGAGSTTLQNAYDNGNQIVTASGDGNVIISGTQKLYIDASGGLDVSGVAVNFGGAGLTDLTSFEAVVGSTGTMSLDTTTGPLSIGTGATNKAITIGQTANTSNLALRSGSGGITLTTASTGLINIGSDTGTGDVRIAHSTTATTTRTVNIASSTTGGSDQTIYIGYGVNNTGPTKTVNIGSISIPSSVVLRGGITNGIRFVTSGEIKAEGNLRIQGTKQLRFEDATYTFTTAFQATTQAANITYTLPATQGAASSFLQNDGSGGLTWAAVAADTLQSAYNAGNTITTTNNRPIAFVLSGTGTAGFDVSAGAVSFGGGALADITTFDVAASGAATFASSTFTLTASGTIDIGADATAQSLNVGTGAAAKTVTVGSTSGASATTVQSGSGNLALTASGGDIIATPANAVQIADGKQLRFYEPTASGSNYSSFKALAQAANIDYSLPATAPTNGQYLQSDASGNLVWSTVAADTLQSAYESGEVITTDSTHGNVVIAGDQALVVSASGGVDISGALDVSGALTLDGAADFNSTLNVQAAADFQSTVDISGALTLDGAADFNSTLNVQAGGTFQSTVDISGALTLDGAADFNSTLDVQGHAEFQSSVDISGALTVDGEIVADQMEVVSLGVECTAGEALSAGHIVVLNGGTKQVVKALADDAVAAPLRRGWAVSRDAVSSAAQGYMIIDGFATVLFEGGSATGSAGDLVFLSASTAGTATLEAPSAAGNAVMQMGYLAQDVSAAASGLIALEKQFVAQVP